jgi:hypothetical protein
LELVSSTCTRNNNTNQMGSDSYFDAINKALKDLGLYATFKLHFGRKVGPCKLELEEVPPDLIKLAGNWIPDNQDKAYSAKMPMMSMRVMGGHGKEAGQYWNAYETCPPSDSPDEVEMQFFPWAEPVLNAVLAASERDGKDRLTATCFLRLIIYLRTVLVQGVAVMMNDVNPRRHPIFQHRLFTTPAFTAYREKMKEHVASVVDPTEGFCRDPELNTRFESTNRRIHTNHTESMTKLSGVESQLSGMQSQLSTLMSGLTANIGRSLLAAAETFQESQEEQDAPASPGPASDIMDVHDVKLTRNHQSVTRMYNEFHGLEEFKDSPCFGGFAALEEKRKAGWRRTYDRSEGQYFSKVKRIVITAVDAGVSDGTELRAVLEKFDNMYADIRNVSTMVEKLQKEGFLEVKTRKSKNNADHGNA